MSLENKAMVFPGGTWTPEPAVPVTEEELRFLLEDGRYMTVNICRPLGAEKEGVPPRPLLAEFSFEGKAAHAPYRFLSEHGYIGISCSVENEEQAVRAISRIRETLPGCDGRIGLIARGEAALPAMRIAAACGASALLICDGGIDEPEEAVRELCGNKIPVLVWTGDFAKNREKAMRTYIAYQNAFAGKEAFAMMERSQEATPYCQLVMGPEDPEEAVDLGLWLMWMDTWVRGTDDSMKKTRLPLHLFQSGRGGWFNASACPPVNNSKQLFFHGDGKALITKPDSESRLPFGGRSLRFSNGRHSYIVGIAGPMSASVAMVNTEGLQRVEARLYDVNKENTYRKLIAKGDLDQAYCPDEENSWYDMRGCLSWPSYSEEIQKGDVKVFRIFFGFVHWNVDTGHSLEVEISAYGDLSDDCAVVLGGSSPSGYMFSMAPGSCFTHPLQFPSPSMWSEKNKTMMEESPAHLICSDWGAGTVLTEDAPYRTEDICLRAESGERLIGRSFIPKAGGKFPAIIFLHGIHSVRGVFVEYQKFFAERGFASFAFDFRGGSTCSDSDGDTRSMCLSSMHADTDRIFEYVKSLPCVDSERIFLVGHSQGGLVSLSYAPSHEAQIRAMVLLAPGISLQDVARDLFPDKDRIPEEFTLMMPLGRRWYTDLYDTDFYQLASGYKKDVMLVHGDADTAVPVSVSRKLKEYYDSVVYYEVPDGDHEFVDDDLASLKNWMYAFIKAHC